MPISVIAIIAVVVGLGVMIFVHEGGHFLAAKLCGVRVEVFSLGFGTRLWGFKRGDTDYRLSALPLGGYVRMAGDNPLEERTGQPYEFLSQPRYKRFFIAISGPAMNFLLAFVIFCGIYWLKGIPYDSYTREAPVVSAVDQSANISGVRAGDTILSVNGVATPKWENVEEEISKLQPGGALALVVSRAGAQQTLTATIPARVSEFSLMGYPEVPAVIDTPGMGLPAEKAGLRPDDVIVAANGVPVVTWFQLTETIRQANGHPVHLVVRRAGKEIPFDVTPAKAPTADGGQSWQIGILRKAPDLFERQGFPVAVRDAALTTYTSTRDIAGVIGGLFAGRVSMHDLAGPLGIMQMSGQAAKRGSMDLLSLMAFISVNLGLLNLLPIPILDGGHVLMLAIEGLRRRDLSIAVKERFVQVGLVFLLAVFAFVMYSDILKIIQSHSTH
ncbi:MAG: RIP metalloprotease RseP [Candidatus Acidiferrales bacterium]